MPDNPWADKQQRRTLPFPATDLEGCEAFAALYKEHGSLSEEIPNTVTNTVLTPR